MLVDRIYLVFLASLLFLPGCYHRSEKQSANKRSKKKSSLYLSDTDSIFDTVSVQRVRKDVREHHILKEGDVCTDDASPLEPAKKSKKRLSKADRRAVVCEKARHQEAKLIDIPIPVNAQPISSFFDENAATDSIATVLGYDIPMDPEELFAFYQQEMERNGWRCLVSSSGPEYLANFTKPDKFCSVSFRPETGRSRSACKCSTVVIFLMPMAQAL